MGSKALWVSIARNIRNLSRNLNIFIDNEYKWCLAGYEKEFHGACGILLTTYLIQAQPSRAILSVGWTTHSAITKNSCFSINVVAVKKASFLFTSGPIK